MIDVKEMSFFSDVYKCNLRPEMRYFNMQLLTEFSPDINGHTLIFFIPPPMKLLPNDKKIYNLTKFMTFAAVDFTPPQLTIAGTTVNPHSGGYSIAAETSYSQQCSVSFIENNNLNIYTFHSGWYEYIKGVAEGLIPDVQPDGFPSTMLPNKSGIIEDGLDYVGAFYVVRYDPSMHMILFVGKCTGVFPQGLPSKELIGQRSSNELVTLPYSYYCAFYEEALEEGHPIWNELVDHLKVFE